MLLAEVIVDVGIWGLNRGLSYEVPERFVSYVRVGSIVRVPLRNRKVRGWVISLSSFDPAPPQAELPGKLQPIASVSGRGPVFDRALLETARGLARRYIHPLSSFLSLFTPPRLGRPLKDWPGRWEDDGMGSWAEGGGAKSAAFEERLVRLGPSEDPVPRYVQEISVQRDRGMGAIVAVPEVREGSRILEKLTEQFPGEAAVVHSGRDDRDRSLDLWAVGEGRKSLVLGGRAALFAPAFDAGLIIVHQEHDPSYKEQRSPYYDAREVARRRAAATGGSLILASATPSVQSIARLEPDGLWQEPDRDLERAAWPIVETVESPKTGIARRAVASIIEARNRGERTMLLLPRVRATRAGPGPEEIERYLERVVPGASIHRADRPALGAEPGKLREALQADVVIATEAALAEVERPSLGLAIAIGVDVLFQRPTGRAAEDAFATLWALASLVARPGSRGRMVLETDNPEHHAIQALVRGQYRYFARMELKERRSAGAPPHRTLVRLTSRQAPSPESLQGLRNLPGVEVLGPAAGGRLGFEILLKVEELEPILDPLGSIVEKSSVLVEMEPRDW